MSLQERVGSAAVDEELEDPEYALLPAVAPDDSRTEPGDDAVDGKDSVLPDGFYSALSSTVKTVLGTGCVDIG